MSKIGALYIVATPIGNLGDITMRAIDVLNDVDLIVAEDTRYSRHLLTHFGVKKPLIALHDFNEQAKSKVLLQKLMSGKNIALISDAGTPLISDPGYRLVALAREHGVIIVPIPGPCALITALCASGLPTDRFIFEGFLSTKKIARQKRLIDLKTESRTLIFYESPHRLLSFLKDITAVFGGDREVVLAKELTKRFETIKKATLSQLVEWLREDAVRQKGEFVLLVHGASIEVSDGFNEAMNILNVLEEELSHSKAVALTAKITGVSKNRLYSAKTQANARKS